MFLQTQVGVQDYTSPNEVQAVRLPTKKGVRSSVLQKFDPFDVAFHNMYR